MKIDSHHHVWDLSVREQDWMEGDALAPISRTFTMADMDPVLEKSGIDYRDSPNGGRDGRNTRVS